MVLVEAGEDDWVQWLGGGLGSGDWVGVCGEGAAWVGVSVGEAGDEMLGVAGEGAAGGVTGGEGAAGGVAGREGAAGVVAGGVGAAGGGSSSRMGWPAGMVGVGLREREGLVETAEGAKAELAMSPISSLNSLWHARTRPPFLQSRAWTTPKGSPQPGQSCGS